MAEVSVLVSRLKKGLDNNTGRMCSNVHQISSRNLVCNFYFEIVPLFFFNFLHILFTVLVYFIFHVSCLCISVCILSVLLRCRFGVINGIITFWLKTAYWRYRITVVKFCPSVLDFHIIDLQFCPNTTFVWAYAVESKTKLPVPTASESSDTVCTPPERRGVADQ